MAAASSGDPGGSASRRIPEYMDPTNKFGELTFLQLIGTDDVPLPKNPFLIGKSVEHAAGGSIDGAKTEAQGTRYTLMVRDPTQVKKLMNMTNLIDGTKVIVQAHPNLNVSRCVISCIDLINLEEKDVLTELISQGVINVKRITRKENENRVNTPAIILTYAKATHPEFVKIGLLRVPTRPYYPNPMLCYGCFSYGHPKSRCTTSQRCFKCSGDHLGENCTESAFCRNCKGNHGPTNRQCPIYKNEMEIIKIKIRENLSFPEARKRAELLKTGSYADATKQSTSQEKLDELLQIIKKKDEQINNLLKTAKRNEERIEQMLAHINTQKQQIDDLAKNNSKVTSQQTGPVTRSRINSPVIQEPKRGRPRKQTSQTATTSTIPLRESPPPKRTAVDITDSEDCEIEETAPDQFFR